MSAETPMAMHQRADAQPEMGPRWQPLVWLPIIAGLVALYLLMRYKNRLYNGLLLAGILPIGFCANIVRVMILVLVTYYFW